MNELDLDHAATTPLDPRVLEEMRPLLLLGGNASSPHELGRRAADALALARARVARTFSVSDDEVVFTSGGTESNFLALLGGARRGHVVSQATEHPSVLRALEVLKERGVLVTVVGVSKDGRVDPDEVKRAVRDETVLVSIMHANNETGTVQPIAEIARVVGRGALHVDAVQSAGVLDLDELRGAHLVSLAAHKFRGPQGVGALVARVPVVPLFPGRGEAGRRAGTPPVALAAGLAHALELSRKERRNVEVAATRDALERGLLRIEGASVNGAGAPRLPGHTNVSFAGASADAVVLALDLEGIRASSGAACSTGEPGPSHVIRALHGARAARSSVRFSLGEPLLEVDRVVAATERAVLHARRIAGS